MKIEGRIFTTIAVFCFVMAVAYGVATKIGTGSVEPVGVVGLLLTGGLCVIVGTYFGFVARRLDGRPEDNPDAEISDGAGEVGFFSPGSYWPIGLAFAGALGAVSFAFFQTWLIVVAVIVILFMVSGLVFEYHAGQQRDS
jgi:Cytochrome c oxidase subunit IV